MTFSTMYTHEQKRSSEAATAKPAARTRARGKAALLQWVLGLGVLTATLAEMPTNKAKAAYFYVCRHLIHTEYNQGWVRIMEAEGNDRLYVRGRMGFPDTGQSKNEDMWLPLAIGGGAHWGYRQAWIYVRGFDQPPYNCVAEVR